MSAEILHTSRVERVYLCCLTTIALPILTIMLIGLVWTTGMRSLGRVLEKTGQNLQEYDW